MERAFYTRPATMDYLGNLDNGIIYSLHALLLCNDLAGMLRCLWNGVTVDEEQLAVDLIQSVGPKGNYLCSGTPGTTAERTTGALATLA